VDMREAVLFYFQTMQNSIGKTVSTVILKIALLVDFQLDIHREDFFPSVFPVDMQCISCGYREDSSLAKTTPQPKFFSEKILGVCVRVLVDIVDFLWISNWISTGKIFDSAKNDNRKKASSIEVSD